MCKLTVGDVIVPASEFGALKIAIIQKQHQRKGLRTIKVVPRALGRYSWCPRGILQSWWEEAKVQKRVYVFGNDVDTPPSVQNVDKTLATLVHRLAPEYPLRVTGHSARKGAALEACALGVPQAIVQAQGGWCNPTTCSKYMSSGWARVASTFSVVEQSTCSSGQTED